MAKRTKLLSLVVAAVMCFACGLTMLFATASAEIAVPTVAYSDQKTDLDWSNGKNFDNLAVCVDAGLATDWFVMEYYLPAGTTNSASAPTFMFSVAADGFYASYPSIGGTEKDGEFASTTYVVESTSTYASNATEADVKIVLAMDLVNGKVYGSVADADFEEIATFANWSYVSASAVKIPYIRLAGTPSIRRVNNVKLYTEDGVITSYRANNPGNLHHGASSFCADRITALNISANLVKPTGNEVSFVAAGSFNFVNAKATTSDWIIYEYTLAGTNTYAHAQNGICGILSNNGRVAAEGTGSDATKSTVLFAFASSPSVQTLSKLLFSPTNGEDTAVKFAINTKTGLIGIYKDGAWQTWSVHTAATGISGTDRYYSIKSNGSSANGEIKNMVCYDGNGVDLGVTSTMTKVVNPGLPATAVKPTVDNAYAISNSFNLKNTNATTAQFIIFEYTLKAGSTTNASAPEQNAFISTLSTDGTITHGSIAGSASGYLYQYGSAVTVHEPYNWFTGSKTEDVAVKLVVNTQTGVIYVSKAGGPWAAFAVHSADGFTSADRFFGITTNCSGTGGIIAQVEDLVCYDSNGVNLGVTTSMMTYGTLAQDVYTLGAHGGFMRFQGNVSYVTAEGNATANAQIGKINALKYGTEAATLEFISGGGALQLFYPSADNAAHDDWTWSDFDNQWYLVEAGTMFGSVILSEDVIVRIHNTEIQIFKADYEFAINYVGVEASEHSNPATYTFLEGLELTDAAAEGKIFSRWCVNNSHSVNYIAPYTYGNITVTGLWKTDTHFKNYALTIGADLSLTFTIESIGYSSTKAVFTMIYDGENAITQEVAQKHTGWGPIINASWEFKYTFTGILPQHLGDLINVKIYEGDTVILEADVTVKGYLEGLIANEGVPAEDKAVAQDLLYYGAAAQLYTGHDVENLPADLEGIVADVAAESIYAKAGDKDEAYYWTKASLVYDNTLALAFEFVAPADAEISVVATIAGTAVEGVLVATATGYEFTIQVPASQFDAAVELTIFDGAEAKGQVLTYSVNSYIAEMYMADLAADYLTLLERVYAYGVSAAAKANA